MWGLWVLPQPPVAPAYEGPRTQGWQEVRHFHQPVLTNWSLDQKVAPTCTRQVAPGAPAALSVPVRMLTAGRQLEAWPGVSHCQVHTRCPLRAEAGEASWADRASVPPPHSRAPSILLFHLISSVTRCRDGVGWGPHSTVSREIKALGLGSSPVSHGLQCWTWDLGQDISSGPGNGTCGQWMPEEGAPPPACPQRRAAHRVHQSELLGHQVGRKRQEVRLPLAQPVLCSHRRRPGRLRCWHWL